MEDSFIEAGFSARGLAAFAATAKSNYNHLAKR